MNAILRDNMPCFTGAVGPRKSKSGDTILGYVLNPLDQDKFCEMYGNHSVEDPVELRSNVKGLPYPVRVSSRSLPNPSSALPHVSHALAQENRVLSLGVNFILAITSPRRISVQSAML